MAVVKELFSAFHKNELPTGGGFIVSAFFDLNTTYTKYEVISYAAVKDIYITEEGIVFQADGKKIFALVEPQNYTEKHVEPAYRAALHRIPYRLKEVEIFTSKRQDRIMIGKEPVITYTSFTVTKSEGHNFSYVVYNTDDILSAIKSFFEQSMWKDARVPKADASKVAELIVLEFKKIMIGPDGEF
ncbi:MAG: transposase [Spirochaetia bacterium]